MLQGYPKTDSPKVIITNGFFFDRFASVVVNQLSEHVLHVLLVADHHCVLEAYLFVVVDYRSLVSQGYGLMHPAPTSYYIQYIHGNE